LFFEKLYSAVAFGSPLLTSAEYPDTLAQPNESYKGIANIPRKRTGSSWRAIVGARLGEAATFERLVRNAIESLPEQFRTRLDNVEIVIEDSPGNDHLLGHYHGVPLTKRGAHYSGMLPDKITIYRIPISKRARSPEDLAERVRRTVWHEIAHHFGISDDRLRDLGAY
jgi:predicted Zn-dependent protease with MMP-like domain